MGAGGGGAMKLWMAIQRRTLLKPDSCIVWSRTPPSRPHASIIERYSIRWHPVCRSPFLKAFFPINRNLPKCKNAPMVFPIHRCGLGASDRGRDSLKHAFAARKFLFHADDVSAERGLPTFPLARHASRNQPSQMRSSGAIFSIDMPPRSSTPTGRARKTGDEIKRSRMLRIPRRQTRLKAAQLKAAQRSGYCFIQATMPHQDRLAAAIAPQCHRAARNAGFRAGAVGSSPNAGRWRSQPAP